MKIVLTGSLGHISKPLATALVAKGHAVTVISSNAGRQHDIERIGATPAIGSIDDAGFLTAAFKGADIVYLMEPPFNFFDHSSNPENFWLNIVRCYQQAIRQSGVKKLVHLSSVGGHTGKSVGILATHHLAENILKELPGTVAIKTMRPAGFYYNMFAFIPAIKNTGAIIQNYGGDEKEPWVSPLDIAAVIAEEMESPFAGRTLRYIASDEFSPNEAAAILGKAIGLPGLQWKVIPDEQFQNNLLAMGFNPTLAKGLTAMNAGRRNSLYQDYRQHTPALGNVKLTDFAKAFAAAYHSSNN